MKFNFKKINFTEKNTAKNDISLIIWDFQLYMWIQNAQKPTSRHFPKLTRNKGRQSKEKSHPTPALLAD